MNRAIGPLLVGGLLGLGISAVQAQSITIQIGQFDRYPSWENPRIAYPRSVYGRGRQYPIVAPCCFYPNRHLDRGEYRFYGNRDLGYSAPYSNNRDRHYHQNSRPYGGDRYNRYPVSSPEYSPYPQNRVYPGTTGSSGQYSRNRTNY